MQHVSQLTTADGCSLAKPSSSVIFTVWSQYLGGKRKYRKIKKVAQKSKDMARIRAKVVIMTVPAAPTIAQSRGYVLVCVGRPSSPKCSICSYLFSKGAPRGGCEREKLEKNIVKCSDWGDVDTHGCIPGVCTRGCKNRPNPNILRYILATFPAHRIYQETLFLIWIPS